MPARPLFQSLGVAGLLALLATQAAVAAPPASPAPSRNVVVLCLSEFPPFNASSLPEGGPLARVVAQSFARAGLKTELRFLPWARVVKEAEAGECLIAGLWRNESRDQIYAYARPFFQMELGYFGLRSAERPGESVNESVASRICVQRGAYLPPALTPIQGQLQLHTDMPGCMRMLEKGRVDIAFGARGAGQHYLESQAGRDLLNEVEWKGPPLEVKEHLLAVRNTHPQRDLLLQSFNRGLSQLQADGSYQRLLRAGGLTPP